MNGASDFGAFPQEKEVPDVFSNGICIKNKETIQDVLNGEW